jgi:integrase
VKRVSEASVIRHWAQLYGQGKHKGYAPPNLQRFVGKSKVWVQVDIPHDRYDADWNSEHSTGLNAAQEKRARRYAAQRGPLPPGIALYSGRSARRGKTTVYVQDGNHRAYAAYLRGSPTATFYMPLPDWERFQATNPRRRKNDGSRAVVRYYAKVCGWKKHNAKQLIKKGKPPKVRRRALSSTELVTYNRAIQQDRRLKPAMRTLLLLLPLTGLRIGEMTGLKLEDIKRTGKGVTLHVLGTKVVKRRNVPVSKQAAALLGAHLRQHTSRYEVFPGIEPKHVQSRLRRIRREVSGLPVDLSPHMLRHTYATEAVRACVHPEALQAALGHKSFNTTRVYLHGLGAI